MSEPFENLETSQTLEGIVLAEQDQRRHPILMERMAVAMASVALAGCSMFEKSSIPPDTTTPPPTLLSLSECLASSGTKLADRNTTSLEDLYPKLVDANGNLDTSNEARNVLINEICNDNTNLAVFAAINELFAKATLPDANIVARIIELRNYYQSDKNGRDQAKRDVYSLLISGLKPIEDFAVTAGQVNQLVANKQNGKIVGVSLIQPTINSGAAKIKGLEIEYNFDNTNETQSQKDNAEHLDALILVGEDGTIYFNSLISKNPVSARFAISKTKATSSKTTTPQTISAFQGTGNNQGVSRGKVPESNPSGPLNGPGKGPNGAGTTPEAGPGSGDTPGTGGGSGTQGGETTTIVVTQSTVPVTIQQPPTSTSTSTSTSTNKLPVNCDPNTGQVC